MSKTVIDEIYKRINEKLSNSSYVKISSITLGVDVFNVLKQEIEKDIRYRNCFNYLGNEAIFGYKVRIAYKRKNLIQINLVGNRKKRWINYDYINDLKTMYYFDKKSSFLTSIE